MLVPFGYWKLDGNALEHVNDSYTFTRAGVLLGTWNAGHSDLSWSLGLTSGLDYTTQSRRGEIEPSVVELDQPGRLLMSIRGSNLGAYPSMPGRAWKAVSNDYGQTWSATDRMKYSDGTEFYSPSAMSTLVRNHSNDKVYWIGNIVASNPNSNLPRYPLVIGEVDQSTLGIVQSSVQTLATRDPATQSTSVQYSNFQIWESPLTGQFTVKVPEVEVGGGLATMTYVSDLPINMTAPTPVPDSTPWKLRYEGNVQPTQAGAIQFSTGGSSAFNTLYSNPTSAVGGGVLTLNTPAVGASLLRVDTKIPFATGSTMKLDPAIGFTVEFRARLNSITGTGMGSGAAVQIANGATGGSLYTISLIDPNGNGPGDVVVLSTTSDTPIHVPDGFNTYRLTVEDTFANLYVDGLLVASDLSGGYLGVNTYELRIGDFTDSLGANWDLDYLYAYDGGAIAPIAPTAPGDYNGNGTVDAADYVVWRKNPAGFGGDPTGYNTWRANFGAGSGSGASVGSSTVPEPASTLLLKLGLTFGASAFRFRSPSNM